MVSRVSPIINPSSPAQSRWSGGAAKAAACLAATVLLTGLLVANKSGGDDAAGILIQRATRAMSGAQSLVTWSNEADDGRGVLHGTQHGITQSIESCDADDPACNFQVAADGDPQKGVWKTNRPPPEESPRTVRVQASHILPSSYEDDVNEGDRARVARTDMKGNFYKHPHARPVWEDRKVGIGAYESYKGDGYANGVPTRIVGRDLRGGADPGGLQVITARGDEKPQPAAEQEDGGAEPAGEG